MPRFPFAKGRMKRRIPGVMSSLERKYSEELEASKFAGEIAAWRYESIRLKLADRTYYNVDFYVLMPDGSLEMREVKGSWNAPNQDMSRVKIKVAAEQYPEFRFVAITQRKKKDGGGWEREEF